MFLQIFLSFTEKYLCWSFHGDLVLKKLQVSSLNVNNFIKKHSNSCVPVKLVGCLRAPDFKEHLQTTACESELLQYIAFIKTMAIITSRGKVLSNGHLILFLYSRFSSTIIRNLSSCNSVNNSFGKWEKSLLCYVVNWKLASTLTYFANTLTNYNTFFL